MPESNPINPYSEAAAAVAEFRTQNDQWAIADALNVAVPTGSVNQQTAFNLIRSETVRAGVQPLSLSAMRQYRDTAARWDPNDRIPKLSYTAHRTAMGAKHPILLLQSVIKVKGHARLVTTAAVREAVNVSNGVQTPSVKRKQQQQQQVVVDWNSPTILARALRHVVAMNRDQRTTVIDSYGYDVITQYSDALREQADLLDQQTGRNRPAPTKVGGAKKAAKKAPATKKAAPKGAKRRGRVVGA